MAVSFDLFGTLVSVDMPETPSTAVASELSACGVSVPSDFADAYREVHVETPDGAEASLSAHVDAALASRGVDAAAETVDRAVVDAFDPAVDLRDGALSAIESAADRGAVGLCSNCSVPGLVERTLDQAGLDNSFDAVVSSVDCGWRKPDTRIFERLASNLDVEPESIVHVGDSTETDGGIEAVGGTYVDVAETPLSKLPEQLETKL